MIIVIVLLLTVIAFAVAPDFMIGALKFVVAGAFWLLMMGALIGGAVYFSGGLN